jgi:hypothetical protein
MTTTRRGTAVQLLGPSTGGIRNHVTTLAAGLRAEQLIWDPGLGFAKTTAHNLALLRSLATLRPVPAGQPRASGQASAGAASKSAATGSAAGMPGSGQAAISRATNSEHRIIARPRTGRRGRAPSPAAG